MSEDDDFFIEDIITPKPKKIKSGQKGKRGELFIVKILNERFDEILSKNSTWGKFSRSLGSGNRSKQNCSLSSEAEQVFASDLTAPPLFNFAIECKTGYNDIDFTSMFSKGCKGIDEFIKQVTEDAERIEKEPLLIWKKDRKPAVVFYKDKDNLFVKSKYKITYGEWTVVELNEFLLLKDEFFFKIQ
jgi:hypothetical protein